MHQFLRAKHSFELGAAKWGGLMISALGVFDRQSRS